ncbi:MAG: hypothetical protein ACLVKO_01655 [Dysgonomonas sp.]
MVIKEGELNIHSNFEEFDSEAIQNAIDSFNGEKPLNTTKAIVVAMRSLIDSSDIELRQKEAFEALFSHYMFQHKLLEAI